MADDLSSIGDIIIPIGADISPLEDALSQVGAVASTAAAAVNEAFNSSTAVDGLTESVQGATAAIQQLSATASTAQAATAGLQEGLGAAGQQADSTSASEERLATSVQAVYSSSTQAAAGLQEVSNKEKETGAGADEATTHLEKMSQTISGMREVTEAFLAVAIVERLGDIAAEAVHAYGEQERLATSLTLMGGSAEMAAKSMQKIDEMSVSLGIDQTTLERTAQKLSVAFGAGDGLIGVLEAASNVAAVTGQDIGSVGAAIERVSQTGQVSTRQIVALGLSWGDLAKSMGVSISEAQRLLKQGSQTAAQDVDDLLKAINTKFGTAAQTQAAGITGVLKSLKSQVEIIMEDIGGAIAPVLKEVVDGMKTTVIPAIHTVVDGFKALPGPVKEFTLLLGGAALAAIPLAGGLAAVGFALQGVEVLMEKVPAMFAMWTGSAGGAATSTAALATAEASAATGAVSMAAAEVPAAVATTALGTASASAALEVTALRMAQTSGTATMGNFFAVSGTAAQGLTTVAVEAETAAASTGLLAGAVGRAASMFATLGPMLQVSAYVALAYEVFQLGKAFVALHDAQQSLEQVNREADDTLAKLEISLRQQGIDAKELSAAYHSGQMSLDDYRKALGDLVVKYREHNPVVADATAAQERMAAAVQKTTADMVAKQDELNRKWQEAQAVLAALQTKYAGTAQGQQLIAAAQMAVNKAFDEAHPGMSKHIDDLATLRLHQNAANAELAAAKATLDAARAALDGTAKSQQVYNDALAQYETALKAVDQGAFVEGLAAIAAKATEAKLALSGAKSVYESIRDAFLAGRATWAEAADAWAQYTAKAKAAGIAVFDATQQIQSAKLAVKEEMDALSVAGDAYTTFAKKADGSADSQLQLGMLFTSVQQAASKVGIEVTNTAGILQFKLSDAVKATNPRLQELVDQLQAVALKGMDVVTVNGKLVPTMKAVADAAKNQTDKLAGLNVEMYRVPNATDGASESIRVLRDKVTATSQSFGDANTKIVDWNGQVTTASDLMQKLARDFAYTDQNMRGYVGALTEEKTNLMIANQELDTQNKLLETSISDYDRLSTSASRAAGAISSAGRAAKGAGGGGGGGGGFTFSTGGFTTADSTDSYLAGKDGSGLAGTGGNGQAPGSAGAILSMFAAMGASTPELNNISQALGLVVVGDRQYQTKDVYDAQINSQLQAIAEGNATRSADAQAKYNQKLADPSKITATDYANNPELAAAYDRWRLQMMGLASATSDGAQKAMDLGKSVDSQTTATQTLNGTLDTVGSAIGSAAGGIGQAVSTLGVATQALLPLAAASNATAAANTAAMQVLSKTLTEAMQPVSTPLPGAGGGGPIPGYGYGGFQGVATQPVVHVTVNPQTVVGQNAAVQLANEVQAATVNGLKQVVGLKL